MPSQRRVNWAKFRVLVMLLVAVCILGTLFYEFSGGTLFEEKATIYIYVPDATGVGPASPVRVDGVDIGTVNSVDLTGSKDPQREIRISMAVLRDTLQGIPDDSYAELSTDTLIGDRFVDITSRVSPNHIKPGGEITFHSQPDLMKTLDLTAFQQQLRIVDATLTDIEQGRSRVGQFILGEDLYRDLIKDLDRLRDTVHRAAGANTALGQALFSDAGYRSIAEPVIQLDRSLAQIQSGQGTAGQLFRDTAQYEQLRATARDLLDALRSLHKSDLMASDQMYRDWNRSVNQLIQSVDELNASPLFGTSEMYDNLNGQFSDWAHTLRDFREHPQKYLRLKVF